MSRVLPILYNTGMVRAILDDRKTATRRVIKKSQCNGLAKIEPREWSKECLQEPWCSMTDKEFIKSLYNPPYRRGDILYVRETWNFVYDYGEDDQPIEGTGRYIYYADDPMPFSHWVDNDTGEHKEKMPWRPSIHMPKEAARIWLNVTDVLVERLNDMTLDDFLKEGVLIRPEAFNDPENAYQQAKNIFIDIWDPTIKKSDRDRYGWEANPWTWVTEFERCEKPESCIIAGVESAEDKRPCIGYGISEDDDEPCEMCKGCRSRNGYEGD